MAIKPLQKILSDSGVSVGAGVARAGNAIPIIYPATAEQVTLVPEDSSDQVDTTVAIAREAFANGPWSKLSVAQRQKILRNAATKIREHQGELSILETLCAGLPVSHLTGRQIPRAAENFDFFADYIGTMAGETFEQEAGFLTLVTREAAGVAALISP